MIFWHKTSKTHHVLVISLMSVLVLFVFLMKSSRSEESELTLDSNVIERYLQYFTWRKLPSGELEVAMFSSDALVYESVSSPEYKGLSPEVGILEHLSIISGLSFIKLSSKSQTLNLFILKDRNLISNISADINYTILNQDLFIPIDQSAVLRREILRQNPGAEACREVSFGRPDAYNSISYVLTSNPLDDCYEKALYASLGVKGAETQADKDMSLCILYESRKYNLRTKKEITSEGDLLIKTCRLRLAAPH